MINATTKFRQLCTKSTKWLGSIPMGPSDPILGLTDKFNEDTFKQKVSLGVGAYRDDNGKVKSYLCMDH